MNRRELFKGAGLGAAATAFGLWGRAADEAAPAALKAAKNLPPLKITRVKAVLTAPQPQIRFTVVKVETSEPGLYGLGCATLNQRPLAVTGASGELLFR